MKDYYIHMTHMHEYGDTKIFRQRIKAKNIHEARVLASSAARRMRKKLIKEGYKFFTSPVSGAIEAFD